MQMDDAIRIADLVNERERLESSLERFNQASSFGTKMSIGVKFHFDENPDQVHVDLLSIVAGKREFESGVKMLVQVVNRRIADIDNEISTINLAGYIKP
jgi:hypothetical protein